VNVDTWKREVKEAGKENRLKGRGNFCGMGNTLKRKENKTKRRKKDGKGVFNDPGQILTSENFTPRSENRELGDNERGGGKGH